MTGSVALHELPAGPRVPDELNAVIEVPRGSRLRYEYEIETAVFRLVAVLEGDEGYPADYGFIPSTRAGDGHLLDAFVLTDEPTFPGCVVPCRPIGVLMLMDGERPDHKILAVPLAGCRYGGARDIADLPEGLCESVTAFFGTHPRLSGTEETVAGWEGFRSARDVIFKAWEGFLV